MTRVKACSYEEARKFARKLKLKSRDEWFEHWKTNKIPDNMRKDPRSFYTRLGTWQGWGNFLGTGNIAPQNIEYRSFEEASKFAIDHGIKTQQEWKKYWKNHKRPADIPMDPEQTYKRLGTWPKKGGWGIFCGTGRIANQNRDYRSFEEARKFARGLELDSSTEWEQYWKTHKRPADIPGDPEKVYKRLGTWQGWGDFLGTGRMSNKEKRKRLLSAKEARIKIAKIAKEVFGGKEFNPADWAKAYDEGKIPKNLPKSLYDAYDPNSRDSKRRKKK